MISVLPKSPDVSVGRRMELLLNPAPRPPVLDTHKKSARKARKVVSDILHVENLPEHLATPLNAPVRYTLDQMTKGSMCLCFTKLPPGFEDVESPEYTGLSAFYFRFKMTSTKGLSPWLCLWEVVAVFPETQTVKWKCYKCTSFTDINTRVVGKNKVSGAKKAFFTVFPGSEVHPWNADDIILSWDNGGVGPKGNIKHNQYIEALAQIHAISEAIEFEKNERLCEAKEYESPRGSEDSKFSECGSDF